MADMSDAKKEIWVFGDYRNYFQNRVTLQLIARGSELAKRIGATVCAVVFGHDLDEWIWEYSLGICLYLMNMTTSINVDFNVFQMKHCINL